MANYKINEITEYNIQEILSDKLNTVENCSVKSIELFNDIVMVEFYKNGFLCNLSYHENREGFEDSDCACELFVQEINNDIKNNIVEILIFDTLITQIIESKETYKIYFKRI